MPAGWMSTAWKALCHQPATISKLAIVPDTTSPDAAAKAASMYASV